MRSNFLVGWKSVFEKLDMTPGALSSTEHKKLLSALEDDLKSWDAKRASSTQLGLPSMDPKELAKNTTALHKVFQKYGQNSYSIDTLAAFLMIDTETTDVEDNKNIIRTVAKLNPSVFSIGAGAAPKVNRLVDQRGKPTGLQAFDRTRNSGASASSDGKGIQRFTARVKAMGFKNKSQFEQAKKDLGTDAPTPQQLAKWIESN